MMLSHEIIQQEPDNTLELLIGTWYGSLERHPIVFWNMSFMTMMNQIKTVIEEWGLQTITTTQTTFYHCFLP